MLAWSDPGYPDHLSDNLKNMWNLLNDDPSLMFNASKLCYVPDPTKADNLGKLREKALLREFEEYKQNKKKLKLLRLEAVRTDLGKSRHERDNAIITMAETCPCKVFEKDQEQLMWYDHPVTKRGGN